MSASAEAGIQQAIREASGLFPGWSALEESGADLAGSCVVVDCKYLAADEIDDLVSKGNEAGACVIAYDSDDGAHNGHLHPGFHLAIKSFAHIGNALFHAAHILNINLSNKANEDLSRFLEGGKVFRVLVADDSETNRYVMKDMLEEIGVAADFASSGFETMEKLRGSEYNLLLLDIQMPGMSGFDVIEASRKNSSGSGDIPIVVITGDATTDVYDECNRLGVSKILSKPVDLEMLRRVIADFVHIDDRHARQRRA